MIEHKNETKIHEFHPHETIVYDNLEHWFKDGASAPWVNNRIQCLRCNKTWPNADSVPAMCHHRVRTWTRNVDTGMLEPTYYWAYTKGHSNLVGSVVVRDEHGGLLNPEWLREQRAEWRRNRRDDVRYNKYKYHHPDFDPYFLNECNNSPLNRGLLPQDRWTNGWRGRECYARRYRHHGWVFINTRTYRHPRVMNEIRQYFACIVEDDAPQIRGSRKPRSLPNAWDDYAKHHDRSWKNNKKLRKQWMVNL